MAIIACFCRENDTVSQACAVLLLVNPSQWSNPLYIAVSAKTAAFKHLKFSKFPTFKRKVQTVTEKLIFERCICIENLIIVILLVYGIVI